MTYMDETQIKKSYYDVLGIDSKATESEIKAAYRERVLATHPDKIKQGTESINTASSDIISHIKEAYRTLVDPSTRKVYDESFDSTLKRQGFNVTGDGLDTFGLDEFEEDEHGWNIECPRCQTPEGIALTESDLEDNGTKDGSGGYDIIVQCSSCSLWIKVKYYEAEEEEAE